MAKLLMSGFMEITNQVHLRTNMAIFPIYA